MAHEITATDQLVLTGKPAWHGLGVIVENSPNPSEALQLARLGWTVEQWPLQAVGPDGPRQVGTHVLNVRSDTSQSLGVVGVGYRPVQNHELAEFVDALGESGDVKIESAGSLRGGKRVWFLARGESIWLGQSDEVKPYLLVANGHDGTLSLVCQPTTIRVVCKNTLHASLKHGERSAMTVRFRHEGVIADKLDDARRALGLFQSARASFAQQAEMLHAKALSREDLQRYWLEVYTATVEPIPAHPVTSQEQRAAKAAQDRLATWALNFDRDRARTGGPASAWAALNAVTEWFDHQRPVRAPSEAIRADSRLLGNWWGDPAVAKVKAMEMALSR
jgi:phage/plasmid-like protein (TIGR03299 family)